MRQNGQDRGRASKKLFTCFVRTRKGPQLASHAGCSLCEIACCLARSLFGRNQPGLGKEVRMPRLSALRLASLLGLLGSVLVISGFFLPSRFVTVVFPPAPATYAADSYWSMLHDTVTGGNIQLVSSEMEIGSFLLAILIPLLTSLTGLLGKGKRIICLLSLGWSILGFLESLIFSTLLLSIGCACHATVTNTAGPGFGSCSAGFLSASAVASSPNTCWSSLVQWSSNRQTLCKNSREEPNFAPHGASFEKQPEKWVGLLYQALRFIGLEERTCPGQASCSTGA